METTELLSPNLHFKNSSKLATCYEVLKEEHVYTLNVYAANSRYIYFTSPKIIKLFIIHLTAKFSTKDTRPAVQYYQQIHAQIILYANFHIP